MPPPHPSLLKEYSCNSATSSSCNGRQKIENCSDYDPGIVVQCCCWWHQACCSQKDWKINQPYPMLLWVCLVQYPNDWSYCTSKEEPVPGTIVSKRSKYTFRSCQTPYHGCIKENSVIWACPRTIRMRIIHAYILNRV